MPSVASAPSLLQSQGLQHRDHSLHAQPHGLASPAWSADLTAGAGGGGGGGGGPRDAWTPGRKRPRAQTDPRPAGAQEALTRGGLLDADRDSRASMTPRTRQAHQCSSAWSLKEAVMQAAL